MENAIQKIKYFLARHGAALLLALLIGAIYAAPYIYHAAEPGYQGIFMADQGDADYYLSVINKSYTSDGLVGDPFHYETEDSRNPFQFFIFEFVLGRIGTLFNLPIDTLATLSQFVFPAALALLFYFFALALCGRRTTALVVAGAMLLGNEVVRLEGVSNMLNTLFGNGMYREFLMYSRPINPQVSGIAFFAVLFGFYRFFTRRDRRSALVAGAGLGALAYVYPYFWLFAFVVFGVMGLRALARREWAFVREGLVAAAACVAAMVPFLVANLPVFLGGGETALTTAIPTHRIIVEKMILVPLVLYGAIALWGYAGRGVFAAWARGFMQCYAFVGMLLIAGLIVSNHQVITGKLVFQEHFHFFTNIPVFILALSLLAMDILSRLPRRLYYASAAVSLGFLLWYGMGVQVSSYRGHGEAARMQALAPVFAHLREESGSVVLSDYYLSTRLTIYTQSFAYGGAYDATFALPRERLEHDYFVILALRGVLPSKADVYMRDPAHRNELGSVLFIGTYWRDLCGSYACFPDSVIDELVPKYREFLSKPLLLRIHEHKADYLLWDTVAHPDWRLSAVVEQGPVLTSGDFALYHIKK